MYSGDIIQNSSHSNYSLLNQRELVLDTAENLTQIGAWARCSFVKEEQRIGLFLKLTRKNLNALLGFPLSASFNPCVHRFSNSFTRLEKEYLVGVADPGVWANRMSTWGTTLTQNIKLI